MSGDDNLPGSSDAADLWTRLRTLTAARIGLARSGASLATAPLLDFRLAHAQARDAVHATLDIETLATDLTPTGLSVLSGDSAAGDKRTYLMRPDLGRSLSADTENMLRAAADKTSSDAAFDVALIVSDGLSARAAANHVAPLLAVLVPALRDAGLRIAPLVILRHGRVAIGDKAAQLLQAECVVMLIGERPGLSAPDSLGAYLTWRPGAQTTDADRNCISNIRPDGIGYADAASKIAHLLLAIRASAMSGVKLKDTSDQPQIAGG